MRGQRFDEAEIQKILDFVEYTLDGKTGEAAAIVDGLSTRDCSRWWSFLDALTDVIAERIQPYGPE